MGNKLIEVFAWVYSLSSTFLFLKISSESLFRQIHTFQNAKSQKALYKIKTKIALIIKIKLLNSRKDFLCYITI